MLILAIDRNFWVGIIPLLVWVRIVHQIVGRVCLVPRLNIQIRVGLVFVVNDGNRKWMFSRQLFVATICYLNPKSIGLGGRWFVV